MKTLLLLVISSFIVTVHAEKSEDTLFIPDPQYCHNLVIMKIFDTLYFSESAQKWEKLLSNTQKKKLWQGDSVSCSRSVSAVVYNPWPLMIVKNLNISAQLIRTKNEIREVGYQELADRETGSNIGLTIFYNFLAIGLFSFFGWFYMMFTLKKTEVITVKKEMIHLVYYIGFCFVCSVLLVMFFANQDSNAFPIIYSLFCIMIFVGSVCWLFSRLKMKKLGIKFK